MKLILVDILCINVLLYVKNGLDVINYLIDVYIKIIVFEFYYVYNMEENKWLIDMVELGVIF